MADYDDNSMQAQLGLTSNTGSSSPFGFPTPPPAPYVRHPGEMSQDVVMRTQTQAAQTVQSAMMNRPGVLSTGAGGVSSFAQQYSANMAAMNGQMFNPFVAQTMASMNGAQGFSPGMMPSATQMTSPSMGIYRPSFQAPVASFPPTPPMPLIPTPFTPTLPHPSFSTPMDFGYDQARYRGMQQTGAFVAAPGVAMRGLTDVGMSFVGGGIGALAGARIGGVRGAAIGSTVGSLAGLLGGEAGFGQAAERIADRFNPFRTIYNQAQQLQTSSQSYVVGGADLEVNGRGLNGNASRHLATQLRAFSRSMPSSGDSFTNTDMIKMTHLAGENGMLNMSQNTDQIVSQMKTVAKSMKIFMQLAGEPDMRAAMKSMGQMRSMGLSIPETIDTASQARMYARMAGTSFKGIMQSGLAGAEIFQQHGLTAGLGLNVGMGAMGIAQQAVAGGAYSPQLLALQGGVQGIAQREMMSQAATLKMPMMAMAAAGFHGGGFGLNSGTVNGMASGQYNLHQLTTMGANNMINAVNKGGVGALGMYKLQEPLLQDEMGRKMGPLGMQNMGFQNVFQTMKMLGLSGQGGFATVASNLYGADQARNMIAQASSPGFFTGLQRQADVQRNDARGMEMRRVHEARGGFLDRNNLSPSKSLWGQRLGRKVDTALEDVGAMFDYTDENAAEANGQELVRTPQSLLLTGDERRQLASMKGSDLRQVRNMVGSQTMSGRNALRYDARGNVALSAWDGFKTSYEKEQYNSIMGRKYSGDSVLGSLGAAITGIRNLGTTQEEMAAITRKATDAGTFMEAAHSNTDAERAAAIKRLEANGITGEQGLKYQSSLVKAAEGHGGESIALHLGEAAKGAGLSDTQIAANQADLYAAYGGDAKKMSVGAAGEGAFNVYKPSGSVSRLNDLTAAVDVRNNIMKSVMADEGSSEDQDRAMAILNKSGSGKVAAVAAMLVDGSYEKDIDALLKDDPKAIAIRRAAAEVAETIKKDKTLIAPTKAYAASLKRMASENGGTAADAADSTRTVLLGAKANKGIADGAVARGLSRELVQKDMVGTMSAFSTEKSAGKSFGADMDARIDAFDKAALDPEARARIADDAGMALALSAPDSAVRSEGGIGGSDEGYFTRLSNAIAGTSSEAGTTFGGKNPLTSSATNLNYAADKLIEAAGRLGKYQ